MMSVPNETSVLIQTLSPGTGRELVDAIQDLEAAGLGCTVEHSDLGPQAFVEWLFPTAVLIWVGEKYFGAMLAEAGKDHYQMLKRGLGRLYDKALSRGASVIRRLRRQDGSLVADAYFSGNLSFAYASPEGWTVKLLFPLDVSASQYERACVAFAGLIADHARDRSRSVLEAEIQSLAEEKASILPDEITPAHLRGSVRLLVFWNSGESCFHVPDPGESGYRGELVSRPLGSTLQAGAPPGKSG